MTALRKSISGLAFLPVFMAGFSFLFPQAPQADRSRPPQLGAPPSLILPAIRKVTLSNGIPVVVMEKRGVPLVQMNLTFRAGAALEPADKIGLASMTAAMLREGAGGRNSLELADAIDYLGATVNTVADTQSLSVSLHTPLSKLDAAFALFADIVLRPAFPAGELERLRKERLTTLVQWYDQPTMVASVAAGKYVFGEAHPYGRSAIGRESTLRALTAEDVQGFYGRHCHAGNAFFVVVGDIAASEMAARLEKAFGGWKKGESVPVRIPTAPQVSGSTVYLIDKANAPQSVIRIARVGADRLTRDYFPLLVANTILGGSFSSRLNNNLREQHGYTYGAGSSFDMRISAGAFTASSSVQTAVTDKALAEFFREFRRMAEPVPEAELSRAKNYLALGYPGDFETVAEVAGRLGEMVYYGLPDEYFQRYIPDVLAVSQEDVQRVARQYIDPAHIAVILVGDRKAVQKGLEELNVGKIVPLTIEDVLGRMPVLQ